MANITGIAITIKAVLPTGKTIDEQFEALSMVKEAHASGDYSKVLTAAKIDEVKSEQKTRRVDDETVSTDTQVDETTDPKDDSGLTEMFNSAGVDVDTPPTPDAEAEQDGSNVPDFIKKGKGKAA